MNVLRPALGTFALLVSCGPETGVSGAAAQDRAPYLTVLEAPPYLPIERLGPEPLEQTVERRRWLFEERVEERELPLLRRIKSGEIGNFGGVEWHWRDGPQNGGLGELTGIVYFLRDPEVTLARYTRNPLFRAARGDFARTDQDAVARRWAATIGRDVASEGFHNMGVPTLDVALPRAEFEERTRAEGWRFPANLKVRLNPRADPELPAVAEDLRPLIRVFPQQRRLAGPTPDIATVDAIVLRRGCFFIDAAGDDDPLVEFPLWIGVYRDGEGHLAFRARGGGDRRRLGRVGTRLQLGSRSERPAPPELARACGAKKIVTITSADQAAGYGRGSFAVRQYRDRLGLSTAEAISRANACLLADERTLAANRLRGGRGMPMACEKLGIFDFPVPPPPPTPPATTGKATP
jgi:hypothetical protein